MAAAQWAARAGGRGQRHGVGTALLPASAFRDAERPLQCGEHLLATRPVDAAPLAWLCAAWPVQEGGEARAHCAVLLGPAPPGGDVEGAADAADEQLHGAAPAPGDELLLRPLPPGPPPPACGRVVLAPVGAGARGAAEGLRRRGGRAEASAVLSCLLSGALLRRGVALLLPALGGPWRVAEAAPAPGLRAAPRQLLLATARTAYHFNLPPVPSSHPAAARAPSPAAVPPCGLPGMERPWQVLGDMLRAAAGGAAPPPLLLHGPPGVGKTTAVARFAADAGTRLLRCPLGDGGPPPPEAALAPTPVVVLFDDADQVQGAQRTAELAAWLERPRRGSVVVATAHTAGGVPPALRRPGRLGCELYLPPPDAAARCTVLSGALRSRLGDGAPEQAALRAVAGACVGCVAADMDRIAAAAVAGAAGGQCGAGAVAAAAAAHRASLQRGACVELSAPTAWDDIAGLAATKAALQRAVEWPGRHPAAAERFGVGAAGGVLLYGPSGCAKTTLARALCSGSGRALLYLDAAGLFGSYVGESEALLRATFARARLCAPSCVFIDEIESVCGRRRADSGPGGCDVRQRVLATLLAELDGVGSRAPGAVVFLGATNHPESLDAAVLRPGRFDCLVHVPAPGPDDRAAVLALHMRGMPLAEGLDPGAAAREAGGYSGADLAAVATEAAMAAIRRALDGGGPPAPVITEQDLRVAFAAVPPSVAPADEDRFRRFADSAGAPA
eukprot:TRINITY_DN3441_c1_g1_i1.p1 TRINITY_DN3441_c1_g1~~TRINITY_DN3441_c1_g1_i1.p1  ORF type:complete len:747 (+),score=225.86 TRINITY_DN3441_c1_g1_i1:54-2243(+)